MNRLVRNFAIVACLALLSAIAVSAQVETPPPPANGVLLCETSGGTVVNRYPAIGTNNPNTDLEVGALGKPFCEWTDDDGASISVPLDVLAANGPTMAVIAYTYPPEFVSDGTTSNPSYTYCNQLQGAINFGQTGALGAGWVSEDDINDFRTYCVFADGSMINSFGVFYKSDGTIRGADLTETFSWTPDSDLEGFFGG